MKHKRRWVCWKNQNGVATAYHRVNAKKPGMTLCGKRIAPEKEWVFEENLSKSDRCQICLSKEE